MVMPPIRSPTTQYLVDKPPDRRKLSPDKARRSVSRLGHRCADAARAADQIGAVKVISRSQRNGAMARTAVVPDMAPVVALSAEAVRKRNYLRRYGAGWKRDGICRRVDFLRNGPQTFIAWMSGCTPRRAIIRFRL